MALQIIRNNIINVEADAIVNTANPSVGIGRGVDSAIYRAAGRDRLLEARKEIGKMSPGEAAWTPAFDLHAKYIIHTVGPAWRGGDCGECETVAKCYSRSLELAAELGCESIAFPLIATGTYGFPKDEALRIAMEEISRFLLANEMEVLLVVYDKESFEVSGKLFSDIKSFISDREARYDAEYRSSARGPSRQSGRRSLADRFFNRDIYEERNLMEEAPALDEDYDLLSDESAGNIPEPSYMPS
jgi:O-acetyl-ADP-ribose deacetylase (regulator of RNase III)